MKAKTIWIFLGLIFLIGMKINAQGIKFGLTAGSVFANANLTNKPDHYGHYRVYYPMLSYNINGYIGYKSAGFWGLSAEPGIIQKGGIQRYDKSTKNDDLRFQLNYLQLPLLAEIYFNDKLFASIGPEIAYMMNAKVTNKIFSKYKSDITKLYDNKFELSGIIGINYNIIQKIDVGLRYNHGLTYTQEIIWTDEIGTPLGTSKEYNQYIQFILRFKI